MILDKNTNTNRNAVQAIKAAFSAFCSLLSIFAVTYRE